MKAIILADGAANVAKAAAAGAKIVYLGTDCVFNSRADKSKLTACGFAPPDWRNAPGRYLAEIGERV